MDHIKKLKTDRQAQLNVKDLQFTLELLQITPTDHGNEFYTIVNFEAEKDCTS
jgi:hypothetical protein